MPLFSSVHSLSCVQLFATPWVTAWQASLSITNSQSLLKLMSIKSVMTSSYLIFCHPLLLLPPIPPSIRVFSNGSTLHMTWPKCWSFSFSIIPSNEHPGLISFRMDCLDLLAVQGTLKHLLQHHSSNASIFQHSTFFIVQLSHLYMITRKTIALYSIRPCFYHQSHLFCPMSESLSGKREGFQDNAIHKKGSLLLTRVRTFCCNQRSGAGSEKP